MLCPYCNEEIKDGAKKCRFCHEFLGEKKSETPTPKNDDEEHTIVSSSTAFYLESKEKTVYSWWSRWYTVRRAKWFSTRVWNMAWSSERVSYFKKYGPWTLTFTNKKVTFISPEKVVTVKAKDIIEFKPYEDGIRIADEKKTYNFTFDEDGIDFRNTFVAEVAP